MRDKIILNLNAYITIFLLFLAPNRLLAQQDHINLDWNPQKNKENLAPLMINIISPEVFDDHTVIFRVNAPDAKEVTLSGLILLELKAHDNISFEKTEEGIWSLKVGPLRPEIYYYKIVIDGVSVVDPANTLTGFANQSGFSILIIHGDGPGYYDAKNVPHGIVNRIIYHSEITKGEREMYVYTPPGYNEDIQYPVLYLLGGSGELASTWSLFGRINFIMDNLLAEGKVLPMIIVMPNNHLVHRNHPDHRKLTFDLFESELITQVMPYIKQHYSVTQNKHGCAIAGLSMGGRHAQIIGFNNLDIFGSFGILSAAESLEYVPTIDDLDFNSKVDYIFIGAGTYETNPVYKHEWLHEELIKRNIPHDYYIGGHGAHDFITWRHLLYYQFLPKLWRNKGY